MTSHVGMKTEELQPGVCSCIVGLNAAITTFNYNDITPGQCVQMHSSTVD